MKLTLPSSRALLLAATLLSACAAAESGRAGEATFTPSPSNAFGAYLAGRFATSESDTRVAADALLAALRADPDQPEVIQRAFVATLLDARPEAVRLARRLPDNPLAAMLIAGTEAQAGRWDRAEARIRSLPRQGAAQLLQPLLLAWTLHGKGQTDAAVALLRPLSESGRLRTLYALHAALICDLAGRAREAERFVRIAIGDNSPPTLRLVQISAGILARGGRESEAERLLETLARGQDDLALATGEQAMRQLIATRPVTSAVEGMAEAHLALAGALRGQGAAEFSLALTRLAQRLRPGFSPALLLAADALSDESQYAAALAQLDQVPADDPLAGLAGLRRASLLDRLDRPEEAIAEFRRVAAAYPTASQSQARLGDMLRSRQRWAEAAAAYDDAILRVPAPVSGHWPLFYARGIARERSGNWPLAEADFRRALELSPEQPYVLNYLGYTWVERGENLAEARRMLERAVALRPQDGNIADSLGWALYKLGDMPGAVRWLERAVELEPRNSVINDHLGDAYWTAGRQREAQFQWRRALALGPEGDEGPKIEAKIRHGLPANPVAENRR
ncbi:tetratricopeptide repeat protein [Roseomonas sp. CECT 9278]|uniref:tetratricopeptide repeat protein n=1 Tax=Roseomonas sp. CECT 9278 TaxID=2845823 RepID=UPI001E36AFC0|nr:tetratricopeptide repeat protein [Roseomonas sp. CECT 9278]CAH0195912.1 Beta-barrel assembly-enhancing protease [Roseomonas sp. CECT 9278]